MSGVSFMFLFVILSTPGAFLDIVSVGVSASPIVLLVLRSMLAMTLAISKSIV